MREILFKAKRLDNGEWVEGLPCFNIYDELGIQPSSISVICRVVDPETVCQYTGLTDKNGVKIWENDIVQGCFRSNHSKQTFRVAFDDGMFLFDNNCVEMPKYGVYGMRVIGNIFDNPELVEGGEADETD